MTSLALKPSLIESRSRECPVPARAVERALQERLEDVYLARAVSGFGLVCALFGVLVSIWRFSPPPLSAMAVIPCGLSAWFGLGLRAITERRRALAEAEGTDPAALTRVERRVGLGRVGMVGDLCYAAALLLGVVLFLG